MKITRADLELWREYHIPPVPKWAQRFEPQPRHNIHDCINARAGIKKNLAASNAIVLLKLAHKRLGSYGAYLLTEYDGKWDYMLNRRRLAFYIKWRKRLMH